MKINLLELFEETVNRCPQKTAVIDGKREITFGELSDNTDVLAWRIHELIAGKSNVVAVFLPKCIEAMVANIGIAKSGNAFMNLDVKTPGQRIHNIISLIQPTAVVSNRQNFELIKDFIGETKVILLEEIDLEEEVDHEAVSHFKDSIIDTDPFCLINTSGSTGTPKGVALNHLSFLDFIYRSQEAFRLSEDEVIGSLSPIVFDIYVLELCLLMFRSATIVLLPAHLSAFPVKILKILQEKHVTFIFWVPTIMVNIANMGLLPKANLTSLKLVWFAGEVFPTKQFNIWRASLPNTKFANLYGPIETAVDSIFYVVEREIPDNEPIPIGFAYKNTDIILLDGDDKRVTETNKEGEICVRGSSLALGYYNNPEKTSAAFVQNPLNNHYPERIYRTGDIAVINDRGEIVFKGRKDSLIKHQGYRIELGEIEHVIVNTLQIVENGCVVYDFNKKEITLFYENQDEIVISDLRKALNSHLPKYMIPSVIIRENGLKRNTNGKIDRAYYNALVKN